MRQNQPDGELTGMSSKSRSIGSSGAAPVRDGAAIRRACRDDLDAIDAIEQASFKTDRFPRRNLARLLASKTATVLIVERADPMRPAGYVLLLFRNGATSARLYSLAVAPGARGGGIGRRLVDAATGLALDRNCSRMRLEVRSSNVAARRLYESAGFVVVGSMRDYYEDGETALKMEKRLDPRPDDEGERRHA